MAWWRKDWDSGVAVPLGAGACAAVTLLGVVSLLEFLEPAMLRVASFVAERLVG